MNEEIKEEIKCPRCLDDCKVQICRFYNNGNCIFYPIPSSCHICNGTGKISWIDNLFLEISHEFISRRICVKLAKEGKL